MRTITHATKGMPMTIETPVKENVARAEQSKYDSHKAFWLNPDKVTDSTFFRLSDSSAEELIELTRNRNADKDKRPVKSELKNTLQFVRQIASQLDHTGPGLAIVEGFPADQLTKSENKYICQVFSQCIGTLIPQDKQNTLLYDVKDRQVSDPHKVRKSITNLAQPFHTDGGWLSIPARIIGLYCIANAVDGGGSDMTSLYSAYEELRRLEPDAAAVLCRPLPWNKQGEHAKNEQAWSMNPLFENTNTEFLGRYYESYVLTGFDISGMKIDDSIVAALQRLKSIIQNQPRFSMKLKAGDFQLVNNWTTVHARGEFKDSDNSSAQSTADPRPDRDRHLIRVWCT